MEQIVNKYYIPTTHFVFELVNVDGDKMCVDVVEGSKEAKRLLKLCKESERMQELQEYMDAYQKEKIVEKKLGKDCYRAVKYIVGFDIEANIFDFM